MHITYYIYMYIYLCHDHGGGTLHGKGRYSYLQTSGHKLEVRLRLTVVCQFEGNVPGRARSDLVVLTLKCIAIQHFEVLLDLEAIEERPGEGGKTRSVRILRFTEMTCT